VAAWILSEANVQAAEIRHEARDQAAASLADAKKEAADLLRQASDRAAAKLAAVESEAAQVQAALMKLSTELSDVAANTLHPAGVLTGGPRTRSAASCPDRCRSR
jgi:F0F1-type ATP synthase membrane subunit b/b'